MNSRAWVLPFHDDETPGGYCSRLAAWNGCTSVQGFCLDMGLSYSRIVDGDEEALKGLNAITGVDIDKLRANSFVNVGPRLFRVRGEMIITGNSRRNYIRVCPDCIADDVAAFPRFGAAAPYQRLHWQLSWCQSCPVHDLTLVTLSNSKSAAGKDFIGTIKRTLGSRPSEGSILRSASPFEHYLLSRLYGLGSISSAPLWLNTISIYKAVRLCEVVGAVSLFGPAVTVKRMNQETTANVRATGYEVLRDGPEGLRAMLTRLIGDNRNSNTDATAKGAFGLLYQWLSEEREDTDLNPVRDFIGQTVKTEQHRKPSATMFGKLIQEGKFWSLCMVAREFSVGAPRLRKYLSQHGIITSEQDDVSNESVVFEIDKVRHLLEPLREMLSPRAAAGYLNIPTRIFSEIMEAGDVAPFLQARDGKERLRPAFAKADLDVFWERLSSKISMEYTNPMMRGITTLAQSCRQSSADIIRMVLTGKLMNVARLPDTRGYSSIVLDPEELSKVLLMSKDEKWTHCMTIVEVQKHMRWGSMTVNLLTSGGFLPYTLVINKSAKLKKTSIDIADLDSFNMKYVTIRDVSAELGIAQSLVRDMLLHKGVKPAIESRNGSAAFYFREDLKDIQDH